MTNSITPPECTRASCEGAAHPELFHAYEADIATVAQTRGAEKLFERFFEELWEMLPDLDAPMPFELESFEGGDDLIEEFRDWFTTQVIRTLAN